MPAASIPEKKLEKQQLQQHSSASPSRGRILAQLHLGIVVARVREPRAARLHPRGCSQYDG